MNKYDWENKEKFLNDWSNSKNKCDFLKKNNLTTTSGNYSTFDLSTELKKLNISKPAFYSQIKAHNPILFESLSSQMKCRFCASNTRTSGTDKNSIQRYRCLNKLCNKSFH